MADKILPQRVIITYKKPFTALHLYINCQTYLMFLSLVNFSHTQIRELVPESQAYMDLLAFERKLDQTIMRKRLDIQEALKRPIKVYFPPKISCS